MPRHIDMNLDDQRRLDAALIDALRVYGVEPDTVDGVYCLARLRDYCDYLSRYLNDRNQQWP